MKLEVEWTREIDRTRAASGVTAEMATTEHKHDHYDASLRRVNIEVQVLYNEVKEHYPDVNVFVNWDDFDPKYYPFCKQRSLADDGLVVCAAYQREQRRVYRLIQYLHPPLAL